MPAKPECSLPTRPRSAAQPQRLTARLVLISRSAPLRACRRRHGHGVVPGRVHLVHMAQRTPHRAVALEPGAEGDLPDPVAAPHSLLALDVRQHIPASMALLIQRPKEHAAHDNLPAADAALNDVSPNGS